MNEDRFRAMAGLVMFLVMMGVFFGLTLNSRDSVKINLYPSRDLTTLSDGQNLKFINGYANWWHIWQDNKPIVDGLQANFGAQIDFYHINTDNPRELQASRRYGVHRYSQYVLIDANGEMLHQWFGHLDQIEVALVLEAELAEHEASS